ncbi:MBL fold metallo-hydrolase [Nannocystis bainbridge]|uniref:MBL fold metallo-hydrolase n=1 Tax=Nannocystis bainbridge TaxID=2995303 RepID=A0ABT5DUC0_9BACT|nr:MBL fold metallo-hydrolase [Nannocystis bainbridge]MDC0716634.1 MBL fold metallo-hydrolase [Nannocystis bainbridge]
MKTFGKQAAGQRLERMRASPRWDGHAFKNLHPVLPDLKTGGMPGIGELLCGPRRFPGAPLPSVDPRAAWSRRPDTGLRATWLGHSTVLLEIGGVRILTDPVWGERASPLGFAGPKRFQPIPVPLAALADVDLVLITHDHYDHLDYSTIQGLVRAAVPFVTSLGVGAHLEAWGIPAARITELDWWESARVPGSDVVVTATPSQHFSGRSLGARNTTLWSGFAVRSDRHALFFSGDTGLTTEYSDIRERLGPFDLVMLEVGAFHPGWGDIHLGPERALAAHELLGGGLFLPVHWGTFSLATHAWDDPAEQLVARAPRLGVHLAMPRLGEPFEPARVGDVEPWWRASAAGERSEAPADAPEVSAEDAAALPWPLD